MQLLPKKYVKLLFGNNIEKICKLNKTTKFTPLLILVILVYAERNIIVEEAGERQRKRFISLC